MEQDTFKIKMGLFFSFSLCMELCEEFHTLVVQTSLWNQNYPCLYSTTVSWFRLQIQAMYLGLIDLILLGILPANIVCARSLMSIRATPLLRSHTSNNDNRLCRDARRSGNGVKSESNIYTSRPNGALSISPFMNTRGDKDALVINPLWCFSVLMISWIIT